MTLTEDTFAKLRHRCGFLTKAEIRELTGLRDTALYQREKSGRFPRGIYLCPTKKVWKAAEVADWLDQQDYSMPFATEESNHG